MYFIALILKFFCEPSFPPPECMLEVRMGGMLVNFSPAVLGEVNLEHLGWIYELQDPDAKLSVTCFSFLA